MTTTWDDVKARRDQDLRERMRPDQQRAVERRQYRRAQDPIPKSKPQRPEDPYIVELTGRLEALAMELMDWQDEEYRGGMLSHWWRELQDPRNRERPGWSEAFRKYDAECRRALEAHSRWPEYEKLLEEYDTYRELGPPSCWNCAVDKGMDWTARNVERFVREHGAKARLCARHSVPLVGARERSKR